MKKQRAYRCLAALVCLVSTVLFSFIAMGATIRLPLELETMEQDAFYNCDTIETAVIPEDPWRTTTTESRTRKRQCS